MDEPIHKNCSPDDNGSERCLQPTGTTSVFERMPADVILSITPFLDPVSSLCLEYTSTKFRRLLARKKRVLRPCELWKVTCLFERDLIQAGKALPKRLMCAFCKIPHDRNQFSKPHTAYYYGFETLRMIVVENPLARHCWSHLPKRINYAHTFRNTQHKQWAQGLLEDRWIVTFDLACNHCGERLQTDEETGT